MYGLWWIVKPEIDTHIRVHVKNAIRHYKIKCLESRKIFLLNQKVQKIWKIILYSILYFYGA